MTNIGGIGRKTGDNMKIETMSIFESVDQLRAYLQVRVKLPYLRIWCKIPKSDYESLCDPTLGDGTKRMNELFYAVEDEDGIHVWAVVGRVKIYNGIPKGCYTGPLPIEEQNAWVDKYRVENFDFNSPKIEEVI